GDVADFPDRDEPFLLSPIERPLELGVPKLPLLLGGCRPPACWRRRPRGPALDRPSAPLGHPARSPGQPPARPGSSSALASAAAPPCAGLAGGAAPKYGLRLRFSCGSSSRQPIDDHGRDRVAVLVLLGRLHHPQHEGEFLPLAAIPVLAHSQPGL